MMPDSLLPAETEGAGPDTKGGESMDRLRCVVERVTYQNETNGYSVIK